MKAIIIAAGAGSRLKPLTDNLPKSMLPVNGRSILQSSINVLTRNGVTVIAIIRGHCADKIKASGGIKFYDNIHFSSNNILHSLFYADEFIDSEIIICYSDILYKDCVMRQVLNFSGDIGIVIDKNWRRAYEGRNEHPLSEAELVADNGSSIQLIGKNCVDIDNATGEFIGMVKLSSKGAGIFKNEYWKLVRSLDMDDPFQRSAKFKKAYLTDFLQELIDLGHLVEPIFINGGWMEIDTHQDYNRAQLFFSSKNEHDQS